MTITAGFYTAASQKTWKLLMDTGIPVFEKSNPKIHVTWEPEPPTTSIQEKMVTMYAAGTAPDVVGECCSTLPIWATQGMLQDLDPYITADWPKNWQSDFLQSQIDAMVMPKPGRFALPEYCGTMVIFYNRDLFNTMKVPIPTKTWTFTDAADTFQKLTVPAKRQYGALLPWDPDDRFAADLLAPFGAYLVDPKNDTQCAVNTPEGLQAVTWYYDVVFAHKTGVSWNVSNWGSSQFPGLAEQDLFATGTVATLGEGSWMIKPVIDAVGSKFQWDVVEPPLGPTGKRNTLSTTDGYAIINKSKHPEEAWAFVSWLTSPTFEKIMIDKAFLQPSRKSLLPTYINYAQTAYPQLKNVNLHAFTDAITEGYATPEQLFKYEPQAMLAYTAVMTESLYGTTSSLTPQEIVTKLASGINTAEKKAAS
ncbi:MAG: sugar ABC transporter substrate-binding protein [Chloroflexi bacterium]|nr:sugar ABC transporter substrate-binding protein [Chloroflexota bacterium]